MRIALFLALLAACSSPVATQPLPQNVTPSVIPADLGSLVLVTAPSRTKSTPAFVPNTARFPIVDPTRRMPPNTPMLVIDYTGARGTFTSVEPTKIDYGCDGNQLAVTPLVGPAQLEPGIAWALHDPVVRPAAQAPPSAITESMATYGFGELTIYVQRDTKKLDRGLLRFLIDDTEVAAAGFVRTLMDGADPTLATIDLNNGGPGVPIPLAAWSIDGSGHPPFLVAIERPGWEGTSIEAWLVEAHSAKQIEAMTAYLYQCAF